MPRFQITSRTGGIVRAMERGERITSDMLMEVLRFTPEPLLAEPEMAELCSFLEEAPALTRRRTKAQRALAVRLLALIDASEADALCEAALDILRAYVRGDTLGELGAPTRSQSDAAEYTDLSNLACMLESGLDHALRNPHGARIENELTNGALARMSHGDRERWHGLPHSERVMMLVQAVLRDTGRDPPSIRRLRNRISEHRFRTDNCS